ncbi:MAG: family 10 glycosylhydrolase [Candidatus Marinimicrobia bacterium]|nr:family 10 glycosylhydrolase [Candidatus Neomarinimicrobiota bacterium]
MKKILSIILLICLIGGALFAADNREWRAIWSITWNQFSSSGTAEELKAKARDILDKHVEAGMNAILWQVRQGGTVYYPSAIEPWGSYIGYSDPGYDPLAYVVEEAHKRGLELHAWFNTFHCSSTITGAPAQVHPEWVCRDGNGTPMPQSRSLSPGLKAVRDYTVNLAAEIVANYDIDGIHFDYVRWNEYDNGDFSTLAAKYAEEHDLPDGILAPGMEEYLEKREQDAQSNRAPMFPTADARYSYDIEHPESGGIPDSTDLFPDATPGVKFASWGDWRRGATNVFIKAVHDTVQQMKPWVKVSPAALGRHRDAGWNGYYSTYQDAARWLNEGWVDMITAMSYHWHTGSELRSALQTDWYPYITKGIADGRYFSPGPPSYLLSGWPAHKDIVETVRTLPWVKGFQFFAYGDWKDSRYAEESSHTVFANITKHPSYAFLNSDVPPTPTLAMVKNNDTSYTMTITPDVSITDPQWFIIYRSEDSNIDVTSDEIVKVVYSDSAFTYDVVFDGLQLNADRYYYNVTQCSRWWIESPTATTVNTDALPTTPPRVVTHEPANTATDIPNNQIVTLEFNKSMNADSLMANLLVSPELVNRRLEWNNPTWVKDDHLILNISGAWQFNITYTITLEAGTQDQIGLAIDGNGDGTGGDAFSFSFTISGADEEAPILTSSIPEEGDMFIDTDAPVSLVFNELLERSTLKDLFTFSYSGYDIYPSYVIFEGSDNRTYVNVKPNSLMASQEVITLDIAAGVEDTTGNAMGTETISFITDSSYYMSRTSIDNFGGTYAWFRPGYSGSTSGINDTESSTSFTSENYIAGFGADNDALRIIVVPDTTDWFARIYSADLNATAGIDTAGVLQAYVFGFGVPYEIRFALRERNGANLFEVSQWYLINWEGWKLLEWDRDDPTQFGEWSGMTGSTWDGTSYNFDSIHLRGEGGNSEAIITCYVDQLRTAEKAEGLPEPNLPPVIEAMPDTNTMSDVAIYLYASFSDPNPNDVLSFTAIPDTAAVRIRFYASPAGKMRIRPEADYVGTSTIMLIATDNGVGELSDTVNFDLRVDFNTSVAGIPETFQVYPNYPNPFNPLTTLSFDLPVSDQVKIEVFNTRGQRVALIADQRFNAGSWKVNFDASFLSSGVYFYKISAGEEMIVNRMTLLK